MSHDDFFYPGESPVEQRRVGSPEKWHRWGLESSDAVHYDNEHIYDSYPDGGKINPPQLFRSTFWTPAVLIALIIFSSGTLFGFILAGLVPSLHSLSFPQLGSQASSGAMTSGIPLLSLPISSNTTSISIRDLAAGTIRVQTNDTDYVTVNETVSTGSTISSVQSGFQGNGLLFTIGTEGETGTIFDVSLPHQMSINVQADTASIVFTGSLFPQNTYQFSSKIGSIDISIPADSAFRLSNIVDIGDFTNDFDTDVVGSSLRASLVILAYDGSVAIQKV